jgi:ribosome biogenesis GTPase
MGAELSQLGWTAERDAEIASPLRPARVAVGERGAYLVLGLDEPTWSSCTGRLLNEAAGPEDLPAVGDWVAIDPGGLIAEILPRRSCFVRKAPGNGSRPQVICANVDTVFVVTAVGADFSPRRIERYVAAIWSAGATPVVAVNKIDLEHDAAELGEILDEVAPAVHVLYTSAADGRGVDQLTARIESGQTVALVGSSGVGKSSLINRLLGDERQATAPVRESDDKGRHTTTRRELCLLPGGGLVIDTPGMRELGLWDAADGVEAAFADIEQLAAKCRFRDCGHHHEPGCAIAAALESGELSADRFDSYRALLDELAYETRRGDARASRDSKARWKSIHKSMRVRNKLNKKLGLKDW